MPPSVLAMAARVFFSPFLIFSKNPIYLISSEIPS